MTQVINIDNSKNEKEIVSDCNKLLKSDIKWLNNLRHDAYTHVQNTGIPNKKLERFKYTDIASFLKKNEFNYSKTSLNISGNALFLSLLEDDIKTADNSLSDILKYSPAGEKEYDDLALWHLNNAFLNDGYVVKVPKDHRSDKPLNLNISAEKNSYIGARNVIYCLENSEFTIVEYLEDGNYHWNNTVTQIFVEKGAKLHHYKIQNNSDTALNTQNTHVKIEEGASYEAFTLTTGSALSRNQLHIEILGENASCMLNGANLLNGSILADTTITIEHKAPNCNSHQNYRNVLNDQSTAVFQGKVHVHQVAQKTDGYQKSDTLLLSEGATMNTKPELEIYADDVKCSHGTTTGKLEDTPLFYLRSRGIPEKEARNLLIKSFISEVVENVSYEPFKEELSGRIEHWLKNT